MRFFNPLRGPLARMSLPAWAGASLLLATTLFTLGVWEVRRLHRHFLEAEAARLVYARGEALAVFFADAIGSRETAWSGVDWERFGLLVESLHAAENSLQYVGVTRGGETFFQHQARGRAEPLARPTRASGRLLESGGNVTPVMVFEQEVPRGDGPPWVVELALRREIFNDAERIPASLLRSVTGFTLLVGGASLGVCLALLTWAIRRDRAREGRRRREEHLMFSGALAGGIAHDFRNPMSSARLDAQMLGREAAREGGPRPERMTQLAGRVANTIQRMDRVFQEFLSLGKPGDGAVGPADLVPLLRECVELLAARAEQDGVDVRVEYGEPAPRVMADPFALRRACVNILLNAIAFANGGWVVVRVRTERGRAHIVTCDSGPGIPEGDREKVFGMFYTTRPGGTGLGLFLARTAVEKCGGTVEVLSNSPGARVRVTLALAEHSPLAGQPQNMDGGTAGA
ncbi:MAG: HAMP domain-containing histidine kinase [Kiritimatiellaeota bacterium]|nr:HAMP domain-containing histidine kinase [Kiritimatiellota bacterium]